MTDRELMQQALHEMEANQYAVADQARHRDVMAYNAAIEALRERLAQPEQQEPRSDYRDWDYQDQLDAQEPEPQHTKKYVTQPEQEFTKHEEGEDGWSDWVCPDPKGYMMKCCDCGLVHEAQFGVVRYKSEAEREDCEKVDDSNLQAVFRMRRSEEWTPDDTAYRPGGLAQPEQEQEPWDAIPEAFNKWWDSEYDGIGNPFRKDSAAYWAWAGWKAEQRAQQEPVAWEQFYPDMGKPDTAPPRTESDFQDRLARAIEDMPFGDTARSFAIFVRNFR